MEIKLLKENIFEIKNKIENLKVYL